MVAERMCSPQRKAYAVYCLCRTLPGSLSDPIFDVQFGVAHCGSWGCDISWIES
jgi:hypothetical protein